MAILSPIANLKPVISVPKIEKVLAFRSAESIVLRSCSIKGFGVFNRSEIVLGFSLCGKNLRVNFLAQDLNDLDPFFSKFRVPDDCEIDFRVCSQLENRLDFQFWITKSYDSLFSRNRIIVDPSKIASGMRTVFMLDEGSKELKFLFISILNVDINTAKVKFCSLERI